MGFYSIDFKPTVEKDVSRLQKAMVARAMHRIAELKTNPLPSDVVKLKGSEKLYRIRVGDYRIVYEVDTHAKQVMIHYIRHRRDVYRRL